MSLSQQGKRWAAPAVVLLASLIMGLFHHRWVHAFILHADTAAMQVLAEAIRAEGSLLPADFVYGNQLILLRSSPFIAAALALGWSGFGAFVAGSVAAIVVWALALYAVVRLFTGARRQAVELTLTFLIPMGFWESDYVLGQQSHLSNVVMAIAVVLCAHMWMTVQHRPARLVSLLLMFLMCLEAPIRGLLVLMPLALALFLMFDGKPARRYVWMLVATFVAGFVLNKGLQSLRPIAIDLFSTLKLRTLTEMLDTLAMLAKQLLMDTSSIDLQHNKGVRPGPLLLFGAGLAWLLGLYGFAVLRARALVSLLAGNPRPEASGWQFASMVAVLGIVVGALAAASLNPDTGRHFLWAYGLLKLSFLAMLYRFVTVERGLRPSAFAGVSALLLLGSVWAATLLDHKGDIERNSQARLHPPIVLEMARIAREQGIRHVFGPEFWRMHILNSTVPGVAAGVLEPKDNELQPFDWLSRPSWYYQSGQVMYY
jgi:hypothetical protein